MPADAAPQAQPGAPLTLGIDTSGVLAVGLARAGRPLLGDALGDTRAHAEQLMPMIDALLERSGHRLADLGAVAVGMGPGPFTGLRVGIATADTLAFALGVECLRVCGLDVLARQVLDRGRRDQPENDHADAVVDDQLDDFVVATDARRKELYWARYDGSGARTEGPHVGPPGELPLLPVFGPGAALYPIGERGRAYPGAVDAALLAAVAPTLADAGREPLYLRRPDASLPAHRKSTLVVPRPRRTP